MDLNLLCCRPWMPYGQAQMQRRHAIMDLNLLCCRPWMPYGQAQMQRRHVIMDLNLLCCRPWMPYGRAQARRRRGSTRLLCSGLRLPRVLPWSSTCAPRSRRCVILDLHWKDYTVMSQPGAFRFVYSAAYDTHTSL